MKLTIVDSTDPWPRADASPAAPGSSSSAIDGALLLEQRIEALEQALEEARRIANYDALTGVPNRRLLDDRFEQAKGRSARQRKSLALLFLDVDEFKWINDTHGHAIGDELLRQLAARVVGCLRAADTVCRYGGDEFIILLPESDGLDGAISAIQKIQEALIAPFFAGETVIQLTTTVGLALWPSDATELSRLIEMADGEMYRQKFRKRDSAIVLATAAG
jgi:diguanylate cyclase (GGDEF)-like protein